MGRSNCLFMICVGSILLVFVFSQVESKRNRYKRSVDKSTSDYVKVFSAYLGEIPMTADIKRLEQNLPSDKKKKIYYLKKSQKYAMWSAGQGSKAVKICGKYQELIPTAMAYTHGGEVVSAIVQRIIKDKGLAMGQTVVTDGYEDQMTDAIEVTFGKGVNIRVIEFLGKHNFVKVGVEYKYDKVWKMMRNEYNKLDWMIVQRDNRIQTFVPRADVLRIYPQKFKGQKPILFGIKFYGCI